MKVTRNDFAWKGRNSILYMVHGINTSALIKKNSTMENLNTEDDCWLASFINGKACFLINLNLRAKMNHGIETWPSFLISQKKDFENVNYTTLLRIMDLFRGGSVKFSRTNQTWKYETRSIDHIVRRVVPYFERNQHQLETSKRDDFLKFKRICLLINSKHHLSTSGIREIIETSFLMNFTGKKKISRKFLLRLLDKVKI